MGQGVLECLRARGNSGHGMLGCVGPWLLTEKPSAKGQGNRKTCGSAGPMKARLQTGQSWERWKNPRGLPQQGGEGTGLGFPFRNTSSAAATGERKAQSEEQRTEG